MGNANEKFTPEEVIEAAKECKGMAYKMAEYLGCVAKTVYNYRDRYPEVAEAMEHQDGVVDDLAEMKLLEAIKNGEPWAIRFRLKHKGHGRGYTDRKQLDVSTGGDVTFKVSPPNSDDSHDDDDSPDGQG